MQKTNSPNNSKLIYLLFVLPFILACLCWVWFPTLAWHIIVNGFGYAPSPMTPHWLWQGTLFALFTLYTFLAIGIGGIMVIAAWIWKQKRKTSRITNFPSVSFIVPAYNEEKHISRCIQSLFNTATNYPGFCEIIVVDDGSRDHTYEIAWATLHQCKRKWPNIASHMVRHGTNLGKAEAIRTGINKATGELVATVDADTWWAPDALLTLVKNLETQRDAATSGYIHPSDGEDEKRLYIILQQLEYSQGLGIFRNAQALAKAIPVVPGPMGLYKAHILRNIINERRPKSITEDLEITLELQRKELPISYMDSARSATVAPTSFKAFWFQRIRWYTGWLHNLLHIHRNLLFKRRWLSLFLWDAIMLGYGGGLIELASLFSLPIFLFFAPDKIFFALNVLIYILFILSVGVIYQAIALKFSYGKYNHKYLLAYTPLYYVLRMINVLARTRCLIKYLIGDKGCWKKPENC